MKRSFKYRLFTNANQERELAIMLESHRRLYNKCLDLRQLAYEQYKASVSYFDCTRWFTGQRENNHYFARLNVSSAQATMRRLDKSFTNFFRRIKGGVDKPGYPRFKGRDYFNSIEFPAYRNGIKLAENNRLYVQHVGKVKVKMHRPIEGTIKTVTLKQEAGKWYVVFSCVLPDPVLVKPGPAVGVDVGLESFLTTSDGEHEENPRYLKNELPKIRRAARAVSRKKKNGKNRRKAVKRLAKIHARVKNLRHEHHHKVSLNLVRRYSLIAVESLNIRGMVRNRRLSRAISDAGWSGFLLTLRCKAESAGIAFVEVDPRGTSQQCVCGQEVRKDLSVRWHNCPHCGLSLHRDHVSARIILARVLARTEPAGLNVGPKAKRVPRSHLPKQAE